MRDPLHVGPAYIEGLHLSKQVENQFKANGSDVLGPRHVLTKRVKGLVQQGLLKLSGSKFWGVTDGPGFYQHPPKRFFLLLFSVSSSALFVSVWACGGGLRFMFVFAIVSFFFLYFRCSLFPLPFYICFPHRTCSLWLFVS